MEVPGSCDRVEDERFQGESRGRRSRWRLSSSARFHCEGCRSAVLLINVSYHLRRPLLSMGDGDVCTRCRMYDARDGTMGDAGGGCRGRREDAVVEGEKGSQEALSTLGNEAGEGRRRRSLSL